MAATLRLMRIGKRNSPFYRIIVTDKRNKRDGRYIESIGFYNPLTDPAKIEIDREKLESWKGKGAEISEGLRRILKGLKMD